ncbi:hypothetical protein ILYODFUR_035413 [Ilyodon furcidens]|uniref:Uncharacterized protein n=1 Tax=Ilyodon furcidens TaxID=33524 RepID=A0ABV0SS59_9TELE
MLDRDYLDTTQAGLSNCFVKPTLSRTFGVPELQMPRCYCSTGLTLLAAARCLLSHIDSTEPVHPPPLSSDPVPAPYYHLLLHTPGLEPSYSPHRVLIPVSLYPSPPGGELTQPTLPCTRASSIPVSNKLIYKLSCFS